MSTPGSNKNSYAERLQKRLEERNKGPLKEIKPLIPAVTSTMGNELCVPEVTGRLNDLNSEVNKIAAITFANKMTFDILENTGTYDPYQSTLGLKLRTRQGKEKFLHDIKLMNDFINRKKSDGRLFIKDLTLDQMNEVVGYENYSTDENVGVQKNRSTWEKWNDENILELIKQGAEVTWYGEALEKKEEKKEGENTEGETKYKEGEITYKEIKLGTEKYHIPELDDPITVPKNKVNDEKTVKEYAEKEKNRLEKRTKHQEYRNIIDIIEQGIKNDEFSFHQVYIPSNVPVLEKIKHLAEELEKGKPQITEPEEEAEQINIDRIGEYGPEKRTGINEFYPVNPRGKYVVTKMLENPPEIGIWSLGTGLMSLRGEGTHESSYQGVLLINDVLDKVLGKENFTYITGTVSKIIIKEKIEVERPPIKIGSFEVKSQPRVYKPGKLFLVRGLYIDALGNFKICQVSVKVDLGATDEAVGTKNSTATQLLIRKMVTTVYPIFRTLNKSSKENLNEIMKGLVSMIGFQGKQDMVTTQLIREKGGEKIVGGGKRNLIEGNEMKTIMGEDADEDRPRKIHYEELAQIIMDYLDRTRMEEDRRAPERRMITEKKLTVQEQPMNIEKPAENEEIRMEQERKEGEN